MNPRGPIHLDLWDVALASTLLVANAALSLVLRLGLGRRLAIAAVRATVQLVLLGYVLVPVFTLAHPAPVLLIAAVMVILAGHEAVARSPRRWPGIHLDAAVALALGAGVAVTFGTLLVVGATPWWQPRYFIPLCGMVLGNSLTGLSLGLDRLLAAFDEGRDAIEVRLALGASRWQAVRPAVVEALRTATTPILNVMSAVGIVTIPGMMTGQLLGGVAPEQAALYQVVILFMIAGAVALASGSMVVAGALRVFDADHRLRVERIARVRGRR